MLPETYDRAAFARRREQLARSLAGTPALLASGKPRARNYAANTYPFRAGSHFLYFFGLSSPEAFGFFDGQAWTLYLPEPGPDDALWEGEVPSLAALAGLTGCPVKPLGQLAHVLSGRPVATLPNPELETCAELSSLLGREVRPGRVEGLDVPLAEAVLALRMRHDAAAVAEMRVAAEVTAAAHHAGLRATRPGLRESEVRAAMEAAILARDVVPAYHPIVTVHGEVLHNHHHHHVMKEGDLLLADVGGESPGGWAADVTRTWPVTGRYSSTQRDMYQVVLRAERAAIAAVRPGVRYRDVHLVAHRELARGLVELGILRGEPEELVADGVSALLFPHGVGHLIGLDVHDMEDLGDRAGYAPGRTRSTEFGHRFLRLDRDLEPGMVVTIEPGLYVVPAILANAQLTARAGDRLDRERLARFADVRGIRIEDDVLVTAEGHEVLTAAIPKDVAEVEAVMAGAR
jgi:Xaa-Pro aminopeptidase